MVIGNVCLLFCIVFINAAKLYIWLGTKKIKATVTSWHRGSFHIAQTFGIRQSTPYYNRITQRNQMKVPDHPSIDVNANAQMNHVSTAVPCGETNLCKRSFITSVTLDHYWTDKLFVPFPSLGPFYHHLHDTNSACDLALPLKTLFELEAIILHIIDIHASVFLGSCFIHCFLPQIWQGNVNWNHVQWFFISCSISQRHM